MLLPSSAIRVVASPSGGTCRIVRVAACRSAGLPLPSWLVKLGLLILAPLLVALAAPRTPAEPEVGMDRLSLSGGSPASPAILGSRGAIPASMPASTPLNPVDTPVAAVPRTVLPSASSTGSLSTTVERPSPTRAQRRAQEEILWLARAIYSETGRAHEQELVAWVIRNRVETGWQGRDSYREVILAPFQFSAFNPGSQKRARLLALGPRSDAPGWEQALEVARRVYHAPPRHRPFPLATRHFYSAQSMSAAGHPEWAATQRPVRPVARPVDPARFRFYAGVM